MSVYLDHNASSPLHPEVLDEMLPYLSSTHGNASSLHQSGRFLRSAIETARSRVAELVNARPEHVIFTSGGTEANNLAFKGFLAMDSATTMMCSAIEHASVLHPFKQVKQAGCSTHLLPVTADGITDVDISKQLIQQYSPDLVSLQLANNETGVIQPVEQTLQFRHCFQRIPE